MKSVIIAILFLLGLGFIFNASTNRADAAVKRFDKVSRQCVNKDFNCCKGKR
jgi:hypothetical protein